MLVAGKTYKFYIQAHDFLWTPISLYATSVYILMNTFLIMGERMSNSTTLLDIDEKCRSRSSNDETLLKTT